MTQESAPVTLRSVSIDLTAFALKKATKSLALLIETLRLLRRFHLSTIKVTDRSAPRNDKVVWICGG